MNIQVLLSPTAKAPSKAFPTDTGYDVFLDIPEGKHFFVTERPVALPTGVRLVIPEGYWVRLDEKSGNALKGLRVHGGIIDETYRGEIKVICSAQTGPMEIPSGKAICQMILEKRHDAEIQVISQEEFDSTQTDRGEGGFGHSGRGLQ
jgi:dUTP pyrophosphatase